MRSARSTIEAFLHARLDEARALERAAMTYVNESAGHLGADGTRHAQAPAAGSSSTVTSGSSGSPAPSSGTPPQPIIDVMALSSSGTWTAIARNVDGAVADHISLWDLSRTRWVIYAIESIAHEHRETEGGVCHRCGNDDEGRPAPVTWPCRTLRSLTWIWETHPDFEPGWLDPVD